MHAFSRFALVVAALIIPFSSFHVSAEGLQFMVGGERRAFELKSTVDGSLLVVTNFNTKVTVPIRLPGYGGATRVLVKPNFVTDINSQIIVFDPTMFEHRSELTVAYLDSPEIPFRLRVPFKIADLTYIREDGRSLVVAGTPDAVFYKIDTQFSDWTSIGGLSREGRGEFLSFGHYEEDDFRGGETRRAIPLIFKNGLGMLEPGKSKIAFRPSKVSPSSDWKNGARYSKGDADWGGSRLTIWSAGTSLVGTTYSFIADWGIDIERTSQSDVLGLGPVEYLTLQDSAKTSGHCVLFLTARKL